jgi:hypothetical protein
MDQIRAKYYYVELVIMYDGLVSYGTYCTMIQ